MFINPLKNNQFLYIIFISLFIPLIPVAAFDSRDYQFFDLLLKSCYKDTKFCNKALFMINSYQKRAVINKKFSCQTRLLGLEANVIMAMNSNFKKNEAKSIIQAMKKYC
tara:strand:- start:592 stop:918 length:327 start_codon:yes stop_codon:yes gene_type:complete